MTREKLHVVAFQEATDPWPAELGKLASQFPYRFSATELQVEIFSRLPIGECRHFPIRPGCGIGSPAHDHQTLAASANERSDEIGKMNVGMAYGAGVNVTLVRSAWNGTAPFSMMKVTTSTSAG